MARKALARTALALLAMVLASAPAFANCTDDTCLSIQKIIAARANNFAAFKGKPGVDPRGDSLWEGNQTIPGLIDYCYVYARGESTHYEYDCDASGLGSKAFVPLEKARRIAESLKTAFQTADPKLIWFVDPNAMLLASVGGFEGTQAWYGGYSKDKLTVKVEVLGSESSDTTVGVKIFAKPLKKRDVK